MKTFLAELKKLFSGKDGELSIRRISGVVLLIIGSVLLFVAEGPKDDSWQQLAWAGRGVIAIGFSMFLFGIVTIQNIKDLTKKE